jgi:heat shock protein HslJ
VRALALALLLLTMAGCGEDSAAAPDPAALRGEAWVLTSGVDVEGWEQAAPSATFTEEEVSGSSGCNRFTASYTVDGDELRVGPVAGTRMACPEPAAAVEEAFQAALGQVAVWRMDGQELVLLDDDDNELLRFAPASVAGEWTVTAFRQPGSVSSPIAGTELTATFGDGGKLSGTAGCNPYTSTYRTQQGTIEIASPGSGRMACETPKGVMEQERAYLAALPAAARYELEGSNLTLLAADGTIVANYTRAP